MITMMMAVPITTLFLLFLPLSRNQSRGFLFVEAAETSRKDDSNVGFVDVDGFRIPPLLSSMEDYPNVLGITDADRATFHPVVRFPVIWTDVHHLEDEDEEKRHRVVAVPNLQILDFTKPSPTRQLATEQERQAFRRDGTTKTWKRPDNPIYDFINKDSYAIGRYDENRIGLYESPLFDDTDNAIDGYAGRRTVHIGMDLDGPVGTTVYAFAPGVIHAVGYNADLGDYGNVIVIRHELPGTSSASSSDSSNGSEHSSQQQQQQQRHVYALYGHLSDTSIQGKTVGQAIAAGDIIGYFGNVHENGGWVIPHVHFQLSIHPPATHDMPGAVSLQDRPKALLEYPDPRLILGPLY